MTDTIEKLRRDARAAYDAAVAAVRPEHLVPEAVRLADNGVRIWDVPLPEVDGRRIVAAIGKAAPGLADAWLALLPDWASEVFVLAPHGVPVSDRVGAAATVMRGAHPYPDEDGVTGTRSLLELAAGLGESDLLLVLLSGGGSALLAAPEPGLTLDDVRQTTEALLKAGAPIGSVNTVRRQLLAATGGGLARAAHPAQIVTLVLSDVLGDPLPDIASGPTVPSSTTAADAVAVLDRFDIRDAVPATVADFLRDPADRHEPGQIRSRIQVLANNRTAVDAAAGKLAKRGYRTIIHDSYLEGEARERGLQIAGIARALAPGTAFLVGGETVVTVRGTGRGGRNHELALAAATALEGIPDRVVLAAGTDGVDGLAEGAGAVVDPTTTTRLAAAGVTAAAALDDNDSGSALGAIGDAIVTGPSGTNVCDLTIALSAP